MNQKLVITYTSLAALMIEPHDAIGYLMPRPRKLKTASVMMIRAQAHRRVDD